MCSVIVIVRVRRPTYGQHGQPQQILDMGETALDEEVFEEYLTEMREHYTADKVCRKALLTQGPIAHFYSSITSWVISVE